MELKKIALIAGAVALTVSGAAFAKSSDSSADSTSGVQKTEIEINNTNLLNTLTLHSGIVITADDVTAAKVDGSNKTFDLGTFCTYTNHPDREMSLTATNEEGSFLMKGQDGIGDVDYTIKFNDQDVAYGDALKFKPVGDNNHVDCNNPENISVTIDSAKLAAAKAGTYDVSLNLATANLS